ncbi:hypothetical protein [Pelagibaculum spongiae]|uniref:AttH domain-containing protein n=1 Tax=Pelagibaculum spongiae TaxID=2080658 RepID=A0A2V1H1D6_9GAMM|nr:hypothetical protein [Pelagibaculum spongiae]PVZ72499.1 hypothetical protein DC094_05720 [Pelagibaculum spongiae]
MRFPLAITASMIALSISIPGISYAAVDTSTLPEHVWLKSYTESFNRMWYSAARDGQIFIKPNYWQSGLMGNWQQLELPKDLAGDVQEISSDDEYIVAIDSEQRIWTMKKGLKDDPSKFTWTKRWGPPFWLGSGMKMPEKYLDWDVSYLTPSEDKHHVDTAGNPQWIGTGVTSIYAVYDDQQRISLLDPWLPSDYSYEVCGPLRGKFKMTSLSTSGSGIMVMNKYGDIFSRIYDFDIAGSDWVFFRYSWEDQRGVKNPARQLPAPDWIHQPKINGTITDEITIHKVGIGAVYRTMRIEGQDELGNSGFWEKDINLMAATDWTFKVTGQPLKGKIIDNRPGDTTELTLGDNEDLDYFKNSGTLKARMAGINWTAELSGFNAFCSPADMTITLKDKSGNEEILPLILHSTDGMRQFKKERGITDKTWSQMGAIEVPQHVLDNLEDTPLTSKFLSMYLMKKRFTKIQLKLKTGQVRVERLGSGLNWVFKQ